MSSFEQTGQLHPLAATGILEYPIGRVTTPQIPRYRDLDPRHGRSPYLMRSLALPVEFELLLADDLYDFVVVIVARHPDRSR